MEKKILQELKEQARFSVFWGDAFFYKSEDLKRYPSTSPSFYKMNFENKGQKVGEYKLREPGIYEDPATSYVLSDIGLEVLYKHPPGSGVSKIPREFKEDIAGRRRWILGLEGPLTKVHFETREETKRKRLTDYLIIKYIPKLKHVQMSDLIKGEKSQEDVYVLSVGWTSPSPRGIMPIVVSAYVPKTLYNKISKLAKNPEAVKRVGETIWSTAAETLGEGAKKVLSERAIPGDCLVLRGKEEDLILKPRKPKTLTKWIWQKEYKGRS